MRTEKEIETAANEIENKIKEQDALMTNYNYAYHKASQIKGKLCIILAGISEEKGMLKSAESEAAEKTEIKK